MALGKFASRFAFIGFCEVLRAIATFFSLVQLPFRAYSLLSSRTPTPPQAKVEITTREPSSEHAAPRDTVLLIHGFPDSPCMFDGTVEKLTAEGYRCLLAATPGSRGEPVPRSYNMQETADMIKTALLEKCREPVTVIAHDWGAAFAISLRKAYPELIKRLVLLDVGGMSFDSDIHWSIWLFILSYQSLLAHLYLLGEPFGTRILRLFLRIGRYNARPMQEVTTDMCHPYFATQKQLYAGLLKRLIPWRKTDEIQRPPKRDIPLLFVYGLKKAIRFHDSKWIDEVRASPCGEVIAMPSGHWFFLDMAEEWKTLITQWLEKSDQAAKARA